MDAMAAGLDIGELEFMDPDTRGRGIRRSRVRSDDYDFETELF